MAMKTVLESLDDVPEHLKDLYEEKDNKFILALEGVDEHPHVAGLRATLQKLKDGRKEMVDELKQLKDRLEKIPEDFDPDAFATLKARLEEYEADPAKRPPPDQKAAQEAVQARKLLEDKIRTLEKNHANEINKREQLIKKKDDFIHGLLIDDGLTKSLVEVGVDKAYLKAAKALLRQDVRVVEDEGKYQAVVETDTGVLEVGRYVQDWVSSEEGKAFIPPAKGADAGGAPAGGAGSNKRLIQTTDKNPWSKEHWNLTEQGKMVRADRGKAERLAKAAGKTILPAM